jgi:predicted aspartyl protease
MGLIWQEFMVIAQREKKIRALIDTGATTSVIRADIARKLGASFNEPFSLQHSDGTIEKSMRVGLRIKQRGRVLDIYPVVSKHVKEPLLIGVDFLQMYHGYIDMTTEKLRLNEYAPKMPRMARIY